MFTLVKILDTFDDDLMKLRDELLSCLDYLHNKYDIVSLNTLKKRFPNIARREKLLIKKGVSFIPINKNKYVSYNKYLKKWRPIKLCRKFKSCSAPICPLDDRKRLHVYIDGDPKCEIYTEWSNSYNYELNKRKIIDDIVQ